MASERVWIEIPTQLFTSNGGTEGQVSIPSTVGIKVKQKVFVGSNTQDQIPLEVKFVKNDTDIILGPIKGPMRGVGSTTNLALYLSAANAYLRIDEQQRPTINSPDIFRAVYEEEPTVAIRTYLVDNLGTPWNEDNPLPIEGTITTSPDDPTTPEIQNIEVPDETQEIEILIPNDTKRYEIRIRKHEATAKIAYAPGETDTKYWSLSRGTIFSSQKVSFPDNSKVYMKVDRPNVTIEIISWRLI